MPGMGFGLLGPVAVRCGGRVVAVSRGHQRSVLAALLLDANQVVSTGRLAEVLWGSALPPSAPAALRNYVRRLRQALGTEGRIRISAQPGGYLIRVGAGELDVSRFEGLLTSARAAVRQGSWDQAAARARAALALWRGEPLADVESDLLAVRNVPRLAELRLQALETRINAELHLGGHSDVVPELHQLAAAHPLREQSHSLLMLALYRCGRTGEALAAYQSARTALREELGLEPGADLQQLHQQILRADPTLAAGPPSTPTPASAARVATSPAADATTADPADVAEASPAMADMTAPAVADLAVPATAEASAAVADQGADGVPAPSRAAPGVQEVAVPRQLPGTVPNFTGRADELAALTQILDQAGGQAPGTVVISAIGGTAGVGKTALAVHWAHQVAGRFPGGQLYVNLHGFGPSATPLPPGQAIRGFLDALGVNGDRLPPDLDTQAGLYRSLLADRQMLIVLDNARDEQQVRPLLPAGPASLVIVTSRSQLAGLAAANGARMLNVDVLTPAEARQLLTTRLGTDRAAAEPGALAQIAELCARLPLALAITAARASTRPALPLSTVTAELLDVESRLDVLDTGDPTVSIRAVFSWSTQQLTFAASRMFRLLGLHPGPDTSSAAAASLAGIPLRQARQALAELTRAHLLTENSPDRYALHDLLRAYATEQVSSAESDTDRAVATGRMLDHYVHTAHAAMLLVQPQRDPLTLDPARPGVTPESLTARPEALAWLDTEHHILVAAVALASRAGFGAHAWQLSWATADFLFRQGRWHEWVTCQQTALEAATLIGDRAGQAEAHRSIGHAHARLGDYDRARAHLARALRLCRDLNDRASEARVSQSLSWVAERQDRPAEALSHARRALLLFQAANHEGGRAEALNLVGWTHLLLGQPRQGYELCRQALAASRDLGNRTGEGAAWDSLGYAEHLLGHHDQAADCYRRSLSIFRELGNRSSEAEALSHLGDALHAADDLRQARDHWQRALVIFDDLHQPEAGQVRAKLNASER